MKRHFNTSEQLIIILSVCSVGNLNRLQESVTWYHIDLVVHHHLQHPGPVQLHVFHVPGHQWHNDDHGPVQHLVLPEHGDSLVLLWQHVHNLDLLLHIGWDDPNLLDALEMSNISRSRHN